MIKLASFNCPTNLKRLDRVPQFLDMSESLESVPVDISQARSVIIMEKVLVVLEIEDVRILVLELMVKLKWLPLNPLKQ